jgi:hypothetical protein
MRVTLMLSALCMLTTMSATPGELLMIAASPTQSFAPSNLNIRARVVPNAGNRALEIIAESAEFYRSSRIQLDGDRAPQTIMFQLMGLPGGHYQVSGILIDSDGRQRAVARQPVTVLPTGSDD